LPASILIILFSEMLSFSQKEFLKEIVKENIESSGIFFFEMKISKVILRHICQIVN